ncbi:hypothetical protein GCM10023186_04700 [Hymenobacter koreensis]|uniref:Uncharacterized protein n=2 Tax=Hymenobacter koreensis TaxID=1084523 RepID=A0ABP8IVH4_9BACT
MLHRTAELVQTVHDAFGATVAEFNYFPNERVLYVHWHGHLTADLVVRVAEASLVWHEQLHPLSILNDKRGTSGDWGEAAIWLEFEWIPVVKGHGLQALAYVLDPDTPVSLPNAQVKELLEEALVVRTFYAVAPAWRWLRQRTTRLLLSTSAA